MAIRLKTFLFVLLMSVSVYSSTPFSYSGMSDSVCPMKCCKKAKANKKESDKAKYLCKVLVCSQTVPTSAPAFSASSIAPVMIASVTTDPFPAAYAVSHRYPVRHPSEFRIAPASPQPIFIQINSFLI